MAKGTVEGIDRAIIKAPASFRPDDGRRGACNGKGYAAFAVPSPICADECLVNPVPSGQPSSCVSPWRSSRAPCSVSTGGEHGKPAGLRTTLLVSLAACLAMLQVSPLLPLAGKPATSFVQLDLMWLPLGILSGIGFIGGGAILHRHGLVVGVATAATLCCATVLGLCFGGGQIALGLLGTALALLVLLGLDWFEHAMPMRRKASLIVEARLDSEAVAQVCSALRGSACQVRLLQSPTDRAQRCRKETFVVVWRARRQEEAAPRAVVEAMAPAGLLAVAWSFNDVSGGQ